MSSDRSSLRDILLRPRLIVDGESSRVEREGNVDDALRRVMSGLGLLDSESLLGWNGMLLEGLGGRVMVVEARYSADNVRLILWIDETFFYF